MGGIGSEPRYCCEFNDVVRLVVLRLWRWNLLHELFTRLDISLGRHSAPATSRRNVPATKFLLGTREDIGPWDMSLRHVPATWCFVCPSLEIQLRKSSCIYTEETCWFVPIDSFYKIFAFLTGWFSKKPLFERVLNDSIYLNPSSRKPKQISSSMSQLDEDDKVVRRWLTGIHWIFESCCLVRHYVQDSKIANNLLLSRRPGYLQGCRYFWEILDASQVSRYFWEAATIGGGVTFGILRLDLLKYPMQRKVR